MDCQCRTYGRGGGHYDGTCPTCTPASSYKLGVNPGAGFTVTPATPACKRIVPPGMEVHTNEVAGFVRRPG